MNSLSFNGLTSLYDQTRTADPNCFAAALNWIVARFPPPQFRRLLEPGIGTGRVALPLAELIGDAQVARVLMALEDGAVL